MSKTKENPGEETIAARAGVDCDPVHGAVIPPVYMTSSFSFEGYAKGRPYDYTRTGNPTRDLLGETIARLEGGYHAVITQSGIGALDLAFQLIEKDGLLIAPFDCYGGTHRLLTARTKQGHYRVKFADMTVGADLDAVFEDKPSMVLIETPSNPLMRLTDLAAVAEQAKKHGALVVVDNTFLSPVLQKPLDFGADVVVHSTTKYINGHGDLLGGAVVSKTKELHDKYTWWANCIGSTGAPLDSFLTLRGLRTMGLRVRRQTETAGQIVDFLVAHPAIAKVYYPGLPDHVGHDVAQKQQKGMGAMLSFELKGGAVRAVLDDLCCEDDSLFTLAVSLGSFESLAAHPATMTHAGMAPEARAEAGIGDNLIRLSIGLEDPADLKAALNKSLKKAG